jgi:hypothetical protein
MQIKKKKKTFNCNEMVEAIYYRNEIVVAINGIIATKISLQYVIFIATTNFVAKPITTEFIATACNDLQRLTFVAIKVYYNKMKVIATKNFVAINLFSCSDDDVSATRTFTERLRSLASQEYPIDVPLEVDSRIFVTLSMNMNPCVNDSCTGPDGNRLLASMNNMSFINPDVDILQVYYRLSLIFLYF